MKLIKKIFVFSFLVILYSCADYSLKSQKKINEKQYYSSNGFALIYDDDLFSQKIINKKINNEEIKVMHNYLKRNTPVKIINPINSKSIEAKVYKKAIYPKIFNVVLSKKISSLLELDPENPYVEIMEVKRNKTFIAKKTNTFEEERNVADTVSIGEIEMDDLSKSESISKKKI